MSSKFRREVIIHARKTVFEDEQPDLDFNRSSNSINDARDGLKHAWQSGYGLRPVLNVVKTGFPVDPITSLGGSKLLYILQPSSPSIELASKLRKLEDEWVRHFSRQVLREKPRKEANNPTPEVYSIHSLLKRGKLNIVLDGLRNGMYSGLVILDRRDHSKKMRLNEFYFEWDGETLELSQLLNDLLHGDENVDERNQLPHFFLTVLTNAFEYDDVDYMNDQFLELIEGETDRQMARNMSLALPVASEILPDKYAFEMASLFDLTNRLAEGIESLDSALIDSQGVIAKRLQRHDYHQVPHSRNYIDASVISNSSFLYFRTMPNVGASVKKKSEFNLSSLQKPLSSLNKIPEIWEVYLRGTTNGHLTYAEAGTIERVIRNIWRSGQVLLNQTRLLDDYKSIFFALNWAYLMEKAANRYNKSISDLLSIPHELINQTWESYNQENELALFSHNVWLYGRHDSANDANQMRCLRSILYNQSSRGREFFNKVLQILDELGHDISTLNDVEDCLDDISDGHLIQKNPNFQPAHYCLILQEDFLNALEKAIGCHQYIYATSSELGWGSRWMRLFKVFDESSVVGISEIESKFLQPLNDVLSNLPDNFTFVNPKENWPTDEPKWGSMMINAIDEWVQGGATGV